MISRMRAMLPASCRKSSSRCSEADRCSNTAAMSITWRKPGRSPTFSAKTSSRARSCSICSRASGRCTFTTTGSPVASVARCTWAIVPAASGEGSMWSSTSSHGTPISCSITCTTCSSVSGGTSSCSVASSSMYSGGSRSGRVDRIWPSFANVGPSSSSAARSRLPCRRRPTAPSSSGRPKSSFSPCLAKTAAMCPPRAVSRGWNSTSSAALARTRADVGRGAAATTCRRPSCSR